jgi:hypothetical protein
LRSSDQSRFGNQNQDAESPRLPNPDFDSLYQTNGTPIASNDAARWGYQAANKTDHLTASILGDMSGVGGDQRGAVFHKLVDIRRRVETKTPGFENVSVTEPTFGESGGVLAARYSGFDAARNRRFHCLLLGSPVAAYAFYYEAVDMTESEAEGRAKSIFNSIDVPR